MIDQQLTIPPTCRRKPQRATIRGIALSLLLALLTAGSDAQSTVHLDTNFGSGDTTTYETIGRGACTIANGVFRTKKAYARFGQPDWKNYTIRFSARNP